MVGSRSLTVVPETLCAGRSKVGGLGVVGRVDRWRPMRPRWQAACVIAVAPPRDLHCVMVADICRDDDTTVARRAGFRPRRGGSCRACSGCNEPGDRLGDGCDTSSAFAGALSGQPRYGRMAHVITFRPNLSRRPSCCSPRQRLLSLICLVSLGLRPNLTPRAFALCLPSAVRLRIRWRRTSKAAEASEHQPTVG